MRITAQQKYIKNKKLPKKPKKSKEESKKTNTVSLGLILFIIYLIAQGIYRCNINDCFNLRQDKFIKKESKPLRSFEEIIEEYDLDIDPKLFESFKKLNEK